MTETRPVAPPTCRAKPDRHGRQAGRRVELKIAEDGELLIKGDNVFQGYYKNSRHGRDDHRRLASHR